MSETLSYSSPQPHSSGHDPLETARMPILLAGVAAIAISFIIAIVPSQRDAFFRAYLFGWLFWFAASMGGMAIAALHYQTGGNWGRLARPIAESQALLLPLNFVLFIPILFGLKSIFPWATNPLLAAHPDSVLVHRMGYMNASMFTLRFIGYFIVWIFISYLGVRTAAKYDRTRNELTYERLSKIGAAYLVFYIALITLAAVDWIMSREAHWTSSIFGFIIVVDQTLTGLLMTVIVLSILVDREPFKSFATAEMYNDLGNLLLMLTILWAYMNFAQFLITWTGNEQEDIGWYIQRTTGGWKAIAGMLIFLHFLAPFMLLLWRHMKRNIKFLAKFCVALLVMRVLDLYWMMTPASPTPDWHPTLWSKFSILELLTLIGIGGIYIYFFLGRLESRTSLPEAFPEESDEKVSHGHEVKQAH